MGNEKIKFVVDSRYFDGCCITSMSDGIHCDYENRKTLEELKTDMDNPHLIAVTANTIRKMVHIHDQGLCHPFTEITKEQYYDKLDVLPPIRHTKHSFFIGEPCSGDVYPFCFNRNGRYFTGLRSVRTPAKELERQMDAHYCNINFRPAIQKGKKFIVRPKDGTAGVLVTPYLFINRKGEKRFICNIVSGKENSIKHSRKDMARILLSLRRHHFLYYSAYDGHDDMGSFLDGVIRKGHTLLAKGAFFQYPLNRESVSFTGSVKETGENFFYRIYDEDLFRHLMCRLRSVKKETEKTKS